MTDAPERDTWTEVRRRIELALASITLQITRRLKGGTWDDYKAMMQLAHDLEVTADKGLPDA